MIIGQQYSDNRNINFKGITKKLNHHIFVDGKKDICEILDKTKPKNTYIGELPSVIFYSLPKDKRTENIHEIYKVFDEVSDEIRVF